MPGTALGKYKAGYWRITINAPVDLSSLLNLPTPALAIYIHEYSHFLVGVTTTSGVNYSWLTMDRARQLINIARNSGDILTLPLESPEVNEQKSLLDFMEQKVRGTYNATDDYGHTEVVQVAMAPVRDFPQLEGSSLAEIKLTLRNGEGDETVYMFGSDAVEETLAQLMEERIDSTSTSDRFLYNAGQRLAEYFQSPVALHKEYLLALCDVSLMGPYPGIHFYHILRKMNQSQLIPASAEDVYNFGYNSIEEDGFRIWTAYEHEKNSLLKVIGNLWGDHPEFNATRSWFTHVVEKGFAIRRTNPHLMLYLYRSRQTDLPWADILSNIGLPESINSLNQRWMNPPPTMTPPEGIIEPMLLMVFGQIITLLASHTQSCQFRDLCLASPKHVVDQYCTTAPWEKSNQAPLCVLGAMWRYFQLNYKKINLTVA